MLGKKEKIIIAVVALLIVIGLVLFFVLSSKSSSKKVGGATPANNTPATPVAPTMQNSTKLYELVTYFNKGAMISGYSGTLQPSPVQGFYLENQSQEMITGVNVTVTNGYNNVAVWIYTINAEGNQAQQSTWQTYYQTTPLANNGSYTQTINIPCAIPPGGAFILNMVQTNSGGATFNSVTFSGN